MLLIVLLAVNALNIYGESPVTIALRKFVVLQPVAPAETSSTRRDTFHAIRHIYTLLRQRAASVVCVTIQHN